VASYTVGEPVGGPLAPGVRATPGTVGYLGPESELTVINPGDPLTGALAGGSWDGNTLILGGNRVLDHYRFNCWIALTGSSPTMTHCKVVVGLGMWHGVYHVGSGTFTVEDLTAYRSPAAAMGDIPVHLLASDNGIAARRCELYGGGDLLHCGPDSIVSQCYFHDQAFVDPEQHADGMQAYNDGAQLQGGTLLVEHCHFDAAGGTGALEANACLTCGTAPSDTTGTMLSPTIRNNYFNGGLNPLRIGFRTQNIVVEDNDWGSENQFGPIDVRLPENVISWSNNRDSAGNLIPQP